MLKTTIYNNFLSEKFGGIKFMQYLCKRKQETNNILNTLDYE